MPDATRATPSSDGEGMFDASGMAIDIAIDTGSGVDVGVGVGVGEGVGLGAGAGLGVDDDVATDTGVGEPVEPNPPSLPPQAVNKRHATSTRRRRTKRGEDKVIGWDFCGMQLKNRFTRADLFRSADLRPPRRASAEQ